MYDYIICGAGLSGLSLAVKIIDSKSLANKKILIIDKKTKSENDRTWSFWSRKKSEFDSIIYKKWKTAIVKNDLETLELPLGPYTYNTIKGIDFYQFCKNKISSAHNITWLQENIKGIDPSGKVLTREGQYEGQIIFDSTFEKKSSRRDPSSLFLWQHFKGKFLVCDSDAFDPDTVLLMDFNTPQHQQTRFFYILPFNKREALIEYTIFSKEILPEYQYEKVLDEYIDGLGLPAFQIQQEEFNAIPMTNENFPESKGRIIYIGTKGGFVKASSGYAFANTQKKLDLIVKQLENGADSSNIFHKSEKKFRFYDAVLLKALDNPTINSSEIFVSLFKKTGAPNLFSFLDEETHLLEDLRVILAVPNKYKLKFALNLPLWRKIN